VHNRRPNCLSRVEYDIVACDLGDHVTENVLDRLRDVVLFVTGLLAIGALIMAAFEGFNQRVSSAVFLATLGVVCTFLLFMPKLEVFKVWGIEAKLQQTVTEAVATLAGLRRLADISARASYLTIAWGNRMGTPPARDKQAVLDEIDAQLKELKVSPEEVAKIQLPFVRMVRLDFFFMFQAVLLQYATIKNSKLVDDAHAAAGQRGSLDPTLKHSELITAWTTNNDWGAMLEQQSLADVLNDFIPKSGEWLDDKELSVFKKFKDEIVRLNADCEKKGGYTAEAAAYYDRYSGDHNIDKAKQLRNEVLQ
jgi:hypothetical protein